MWSPEPGRLEHSMDCSVQDGLKDLWIEQTRQKKLSSQAKGNGENAREGFKRHFVARTELTGL